MEKEEAAVVMRDLVRAMVLAVVFKPESVKVTAHIGHGVTVNVIVAADDFGQAIGTHGRMARAMRTVLGGASWVSGVPVAIDIQKAADR